MTTLQIIGASCAVPNPARATSSYLYRTDGLTLLVECGHGAIGTLQRYADPADLNAIVISHMHPDHCWDLVALRNYLYVHELPAIPLFLPGNGPAILRSIAVALEQPETYFDATFVLHTYGPETPFALGDVRIAALRTVHNIEANALSVTDKNGGRLVFSSDTAYFADLAAFARDCDVLLAEMTDSGEPIAGDRWHMGPQEVATLVHQARPKLTLLTHYFDEYAQAGHTKVASECHPYPIRLAVEGESHAIG